MKAWARARWCIAKRGSPDLRTIETTAAKAWDMWLDIVFIMGDRRAARRHWEGFGYRAVRVNVTLAQPPKPKRSR